MNVGYLLFPNLTQLDFTGPLQILSRVPGARSYIAARSLDPVPSDCGLGLMPTITLAECPPLEVLVVPGGLGVDDPMRDPAVLAFVRRQAEGARYVTSVCTGAFILGVAGLLRGRRATTHWAYHHLLVEVGAVPVHDRVVKDGKVVTGGGVTAGIDFGLALAAEMSDAETARCIQLAVEYDPAPPFGEGSPGRASLANVERLRELYRPRLETFAEALRMAMASPA